MALMMERDESGKVVKSVVTDYSKKNSDENVEAQSKTDDDKKKANSKKNSTEKNNTKKTKEDKEPKNDNTKSVLDELNKVDGFDPKSYVIEIDQDGDTIEYLKVAHRILWFRLKYPNGKIDKKVVELNQKFCVIETKVYANKNDKENEYISNGFAQRYLDEPKLGKRFVELAETASVGRALESAGFGTQFSLENEVKAKNTIPTNEDVDIEEEQPKHPILSKGNVNPNKEETTDMTLGDALNYIMGIGTYSSKTLGWCLENQPNLFWYFANTYDGNDEQLKKAVKIIVNDKENINKAN